MLIKIVIFSNFKSEATFVLVVIIRELKVYAFYIKFVNSLNVDWCLIKILTLYAHLGIPRYLTSLGILINLFPITISDLPKI